MRAAYRAYAYLGLLSPFAALIWGFRYDPVASTANYAIAIALYLLFIVPHLLMTTAWFKHKAWGSKSGTPSERRVYVLVGVTLWLFVFAVHPPVPGPMVILPAWISFVGLLATLLCFGMFFEGASRTMLDGMLAVPGAALSHSHGAETPLLTEGAYAEVRHPMYRGFVLGCLASLLVHPNAGQLLWAAMLAATFIAFIPVEERNLRHARGEAYLTYCRQTPYRLFRRVW